MSFMRQRYKVMAWFEGALVYNKRITRKDEAVRQGFKFVEVFDSLQRCDRAEQWRVRVMNVWPNDDEVRTLYDITDHDGVRTLYALEQVMRNGTVERDDRTAKA
jgi:hypothetical protein